MPLKSPKEYTVNELKELLWVQQPYAKGAKAELITRLNEKIPMVQKKTGQKICEQI